MEKSRLISQRKPSADGSVNPLATTEDEQSTTQGNSNGADLELNEPRKIESRPGSSRSHYEELTTLAYYIPWCVKVQNKLYFKISLFLLTFGLDFTDFLVDWLLFRDIYGIKPGLVYGPIESTITFSLLTFDIIGTIAIVFETANIAKELFFEHAWINPDIVSCFFLWVEDIPQLVLGVRIALCREEAISLFQVIKAAVLIYGIVIRIMLLSLRYFNKKGFDALEGLRKGVKNAVKFFFISGMTAILLGSVSVFLLTMFERDSHENIRFNHPKSIFEEDYNEARYFDNVSMYFNHPIFDFDNYNNETNRLHFIRLLSIYEMRSNKSALFKISFDEVTKTKLVIWKEDKSGNLTTNECYRINPLQGTITYHNQNCEQFLWEYNILSFIFKFQFIKESIPEQRFGDIHYNMQVKESGNCHGPKIDIVTRLENPKGQGHYNSAVIHYYKTHAGVSQDHHLIVEGENNARFYVNEEDLIDITSVWRTGFSFCRSTGSLAPDISQDIKVPCNV